MANKRSENAKAKSLRQLRELLSDPEYRGRRVSVSEVVSKLGKSRQWFYEYIGNATLAQEWLTINQQAPTDAKVHYQSMLNKALGEIEPKDVKVETQTANGKREFFVTKETAKEKTKQVGHVIAETIRPPKVTTVEKVVEIVEVSEHDQWINRIRENYVTAELGDLPSVSKIMLELGLLDRDGGPLKGLTEDEVRRRMALEDWKGQRSEFLHKTLDVIPDEIKMVTMMRNVEVQKILYQEIKMLNRMNTQYRTRGEVTTLDGKTRLDYEPDSGTIAGLAEVMRRMVDSGTNVNFLQINQFGGGGGSKGGNEISAVTRTYLARLASMDEGQIKSELDRFQALAKVLGEGEKGRLTLEEIEAQSDVLDIEVTGVNCKVDGDTSGTKT